MARGFMCYSYTTDLAARRDSHPDLIISSDNPDRTTRLKYGE